VWEWAVEADPSVRCGDAREEERRRRVIDRPREEERAAELVWEWAVEADPDVRCGDAREEERRRRVIDRPREEERAAEDVGRSDRPFCGNGTGRRRCAVAEDRGSREEEKNPTIQTQFSYAA